MNDQRLFQILLAPHVSEKTATAAEMQGRHAFKVANDATKLEVRKAVEQLFKVDVKSVQIVKKSTRLFTAVWFKHVAFMKRKKGSM